LNLPLRDQLITLTLAEKILHILTEALQAADVGAERSLHLISVVGAVLTKATWNEQDARSGAQTTEHPPLQKLVEILHATTIVAAEAKLDDEKWKAQLRSQLDDIQ